MNPIPKLSASLILSRLTPNSILDNNNCNYQLLFVKRPHNVNFPNCLAFPGGILDQMDYALCQNIHYKHIIKP
jgi:8-oxo-dGTP pyrophosphatase MutT (NUDIX family)